MFAVSYKVTRQYEAVSCEAPGHFDTRATRLHNPVDVNDGVIMMNLSHFLPGGGAEMAPAGFEMIYYVVEGEMTITLRDEAEQEQGVVLKAGDSVHFGKGTQRSCLNTGTASAQMLVVMVKK